MLLLDLNRVAATSPKVVAAACRIRDEQTSGGTLRCRADGIGDTTAIVQIATSKPPEEILVAGKPLGVSQYDYSQGMLRLRFPNSVEPIQIQVRFSRASR